jgi:CRP-like cAMP-binding protein
MDDLNERTNALKKMPLLSDLPHGELESIAKRLKIESYEQGVDIIRQGTSGSSAYFVLSGRCDVRRGASKGGRRLSFLEPGDFFGELSILLPAPRSATVIAYEPTVVLVLTAHEFKSALTSNKSMAMHLVKILAKRLQGKEEEFS